MTMDIKALEQIALKSHGSEMPLMDLKASEVDCSLDDTERLLQIDIQERIESVRHASSNGEILEYGLKAVEG